MDRYELERLLQDGSLSLASVESQLLALGPEPANVLLHELLAARDSMLPEPRSRLEALARGLARTTARIAADAGAAATQLRAPEGASGPPAVDPRAAHVIAAGSAPATQLRSTEARVTPASVTPTPGLVLSGHYRLESQIGQGSMGQVWRARDLLSEEAGASQSSLAIKLFVYELARDPLALSIMQRETSRAQAISHPNIVAVRFFDRDPQTGLIYMGMELVDGQPLDEVLRNAGSRGLERKRGVAIIRGIAEGLGYAHLCGIVHCDLKPGNVILTRADVPKILDFGIAQAVQHADARENAAPVVSGYTQMYASAEALSDQPPDTADDVYSLGLVAYEILSGRHPFGGRSAREALRDGLKPAKISGLRGHQWRAISRALALERSHRWKDANQFRKAFAGTSVALKLLAAAVVLLSVTASVATYRSYIASGPAVPLTALQADVQAKVRKALADGNGALDYMHRTHDYSVVDDAVSYFDTAYALHPRDRDAVAGLKATAGLFLEGIAAAPRKDEAIEELQTFKAHTVQSHFYEHYAALDEAIERYSAQGQQGR
jgi:hypothetical protein